MESFGDKTSVKEILGLTFIVPHPITEALDSLVEVMWERRGLKSGQDVYLTHHMIDSTRINDPSRIATRKTYSGVICLNQYSRG